MMSRTQINLAPETQRRARRRAAEMGISLAEYVRRLVAHDLDEPRRTVDVGIVFDLGSSSGAEVARNKDAMLGDAVASLRARRSRR